MSKPRIPRHLLCARGPSLPSGLHHHTPFLKRIPSSCWISGWWLGFFRMPNWQDLVTCRGMPHSPWNITAANAVCIEEPEKASEEPVPSHLLSVQDGSTRPWAGESTPFLLRVPCAHEALKLVPLCSSLGVFSRHKPVRESSGDALSGKISAPPT